MVIVDGFLFPNCGAVINVDVGDDVDADVVGVVATVVVSGRLIKGFISTDLPFMDFETFLFDSV